MSHALKNLFVNNKKKRSCSQAIMSLKQIAVLHLAGIADLAAEQQRVRRPFNDKESKRPIGIEPRWCSLVSENAAGGCVRHSSHLVDLDQRFVYDSGQIHGVLGDFR